MRGLGLLSLQKIDGAVHVRVTFVKREMGPTNSQKNRGKMKKFDQDFIKEMKDKLDVEMIGVASVEASASKELKEKATSLLPGARSVIVMGKEIYKEVVSLLKASKQAGEAES